ncbi:hypothetical protein PV328_004215 [Microctonus aethiopoides]|uniref:Uncharacterized protein n=1 Tax=Microctonus aethiopoides TaxID=144406 RepID=A0AA39KLG5_9HYME|nr:hypothetical protein PV328_004215 [Microctonus aethiopoides]
MKEFFCVTQEKFEKSLSSKNIFYEPRSLDENFKKDEDEGYLKELTTESVEKQEPGDVQPGEQCKEFKICTFCKKPVCHVLKNYKCTDSKISGQQQVISSIKWNQFRNT